MPGVGEDEDRYIIRGLGARARARVRAKGKG